MKISVYSDESGVFDVQHNKYYVYGGLVFFSFDEESNLRRKYLSIERLVKRSSGLNYEQEAKATALDNK